jgi:hypothetical protein
MGKARHENSWRQIGQEFGFQRPLLRSRTRWIPIASRKRKSSDLVQRGGGEIVNVQPRNGKAKPYQVKQVRELLLKYKIDIE